FVSLSIVFFVLLLPRPSIYTLFPYTTLFRSEAAHFIALYALGVVVGAPILTIFTGKIAPKKVLLLLMLLFIAFNGLFAIAPDYNTLAISRFMSGLPHGAFFGVGSVVAAQLAAKGKEAQAIAFMFTGMTIANLAGVPLG